MGSDEKWFVYRSRKRGKPAKTVDNASRVLGLRIERETERAREREIVCERETKREGEKDRETD